MRQKRRRTILVLLAAATLIPIAALGWLAVNILRQDRDIEGQHRLERLKYAGGQVALAVEGRLGSMEEQLGQGRGIRFGPDGLDPAGGSIVLYQPKLKPGRKAPESVFAGAEALEYQRKDLPGAAQEYRRLAEAPDAALRAEALVRLGAVLRNLHDRAGALQVYARLAAMGPAPVDEQPAEMIARQARCRMYAEAGDREHLQKETADLGRALYSGAFRIDRATFELYRDMLRDWGGPAPAPTDIARTEAAIGLWQTWRAAELPARGRKIVHPDGTAVLAIWTAGQSGPIAWLASPPEIEAALGPLWNQQRLAAALYDPEGQRLFGPELANAATFTQDETHLPFILRLAFLPGQQDAAGYRTRRRLLIAGLLFAFTLMLAAAYGLYRATAREMALVRQQSDFVSAVSHEFRTPLTSMRHLTELLATNSVPGEERKAQYYALLARETERLHRMVDSLLSFGRMQAGAHAWRLEPADARQLLRGVVEEFRREPHSRGREVVCETENDLPPIEADREALSRAVANLLENAEKYSDPGTPIRVLARRSGGTLLISVEDRGVGIPPDEQKTLFRTFVRGAEAQRAGIRGIGVGLALVKSVAEAHGGSVQVASEPGRGSTFTLVIPCRES